MNSRIEDLSPAVKDHLITNGFSAISSNLYYNRNFCGEKDVSHLELLDTPASACAVEVVSFYWNETFFYNMMQLFSAVRVANGLLRCAYLC